MAKLIFLAGGPQAAPIELNWGTTRLGRGPTADVQIDHPTISSRHCEILLSDTGGFVSDNGSTNGTFVNRQPVSASTPIEHGDLLRIGDVEMTFEQEQTIVSVPKVAATQVEQSYRLPDGALSCLHHPNVPATYQCTQCHKVFCNACMESHNLRIAGRRLHRFCPACRGECALVPDGKGSKRKSFFGFLEDTLKIRIPGTRRPRK